MSSIPPEFIFPQQKQNQQQERDQLEEGEFLTSLFEEDENEEEECETQQNFAEKIKIGENSHRRYVLEFNIRCPPDIGTFFAHKVWSGSKYLSRYLWDNPKLICSKRVVELGAGSGLPSLVSLALGCSYCIITDYPDEQLLSTLRENVGLNWDTIMNSVILDELNASASEKHRTNRRVQVLGHE